MKRIQKRKLGYEKLEDRRMLASFSCPCGDVLATDVPGKFQQVSMLDTDVDGWEVKKMSLIDANVPHKFQQVSNMDASVPKIDRI